MECDENPGTRLIVVQVAITPVKGITRVSHPPMEIKDRFKTKVQAED